jgi:hypothetical protein
VKALNSDRAGHSGLLPSSCRPRRSEPDAGR